jgi:glycerol kinase
VANEYILALDQGTTSSRSIIVDRAGAIRAAASQEFRQIYPQPGWVEHDPEEIWQTQIATAHEAIARAGIQPGDIAAIGITNQRETTVLWEAVTGSPIHNAIVWQCRRTAPACDRLRDERFDHQIRRRTGLVTDAYFSATKVQWLLENVHGAPLLAARGELQFGTIDSWLLYKLTGVHATDYSNASRTMLYNIHERNWDPVLLEKFGVPIEILPEVRDTSAIYGTTSLFGPAIPVAALCGDQQSALFGQAAFKPRQCKNTYGTGCFLLMNTGETAVDSKHGLLTTIAWGLDGRITYALEGSVFAGGAVVQWLRDEMKFIASAAESEQVAASVTDNGGVYFVPAFVGLGAPHWNARVRGTLTGITRGTTPAHIVRAGLEAIAFQSADLIRCMEADIGEPIPSLNVDGGAAANNLLMQHQADILGIPINRGRTVETTALGAAFFAGLAVGLWQDLTELETVWQHDQRFEPQWDATTRAAAMAGWDNVIKMVTM